MSSRSMLYEINDIFARTSPPQTHEERRLIAKWLANPDNYARMISRKQEGSAFCDAPAHGTRAEFAEARKRGLKRWR